MCKSRWMCNSSIIRGFPRVINYFYQKSRQELQCWTSCEEETRAKKLCNTRICWLLLWIIHQNVNNNSWRHHYAQVQFDKPLLSELGNNPLIVMSKIVFQAWKFWCVMALCSTSISAVTDFFYETQKHLSWPSVKDIWENF